MLKSIIPLKVDQRHGPGNVCCFAPNMAFGTKLVFCNLWLFGPLLKKVMPAISPAGAAMLQTTIAFTMASGSGGLMCSPGGLCHGKSPFYPPSGTDENIAVISGVAKKHNIETEVIYKDYPCPVVDYNAAL